MSSIDKRENEFLKGQRDPERTREKMREERSSVNREEDEKV